MVRRKQERTGFQKPGRREASVWLSAVARLPEKLRIRIGISFKM